MERMEQCVVKLEAMFQKADSDINCLSQRLNQQFENDTDAPVNPVDLLSKVNEVKKEYVAVVRQAEAIKAAQQEAVSEFTSSLNDVCQLLLKLQTATGSQSLEEKPEELCRLEKFLGQEIPWGQSDGQGTEDTSHSIVHTCRDDADTNNNANCSASSSENPLSPCTQRRTSGEFLEVNQQEFDSLSSTVRGRATLRDVNITYRILWHHFKENKNQKTLTSEEMYKLGLRVSGATGMAKLKILKALQLIKLTHKGQVSMC